jgi:hypothetical protein
MDGLRMVLMPGVMLDRGGAWETTAVGGDELQRI